MALAKASPQPVQLIRFALIMGVLMFGGVTLVIHRQSSWKPGTLPAIAGYALMAVSIVAVAVARSMRSRVLREQDPQRRATLLLTGWTAGEAAGLLGGVLFLVTGQGQWYMLGLLAMLTNFALLPVRRPT